MPNEGVDDRSQSPEAGAVSPLHRNGPIVRNLAVALALVLPYASPVALYFVYQPINEEWTVKQFGCGCPRLDGTPHFNANDFNLILVGLVDLFSVPWWLIFTKRIVSTKRWPLVAFVGTFVILMISLRVFGRMFWL